MRLLSENLPLDLLAGPVFPKTYPDIEPDAFSNSDHFPAGAAVRRLRTAACGSAGGVAARER